MDQRFDTIDKAAGWDWSAGWMSSTLVSGILS